jgi:ATP-dependent Clp protease adaptor protein ClpS
MKGKKHYQEQHSLEEILENGSKGVNFLTLHNDEIHTFEFVIESLMEVCSHTMEQAEQCAYLVHYKGSCDILKGTYLYLTPLRKELNRRGLHVTID